MVRPQDPDENSLKRVVKAAVIEALEERREFLRDVVAEVLEDVAMAEAIREGRQTEPTTHKEVLKALKEEG